MYSDLKFVVLMKNSFTFLPKWIPYILITVCEFWVCYACGDFHLSVLTLHWFLHPVFSVFPFQPFSWLFYSLFFILSFFPLSPLFLPLSSTGNGNIQIIGNQVSPPPPPPCCCWRWHPGLALYMLDKCPVTELEPLATQDPFK